MRSGFASAALFAATLVAALGGATVVSEAYPLTHDAPHVRLHRSTPPTTAECVAETGLACYQPYQIERAYDLPRLWAEGDEGQGQTIVIVDSFGSPTIKTDLQQFDTAFHLPNPPSLEVIQPAGAVPPFEAGNEEMTGWAEETSIDVEWSHAVAPQARIVLVETPVAETEGVQGFPQIVEAENYVIDHHLGEVISQSFGATEETFPNVQTLYSLRSANYNAAAHGVTMLAASGDEGVAGPNLEYEFYPFQVNEWPPSDPLVTAVGGTQLHLNEAGQRTQPDNVWNELLPELPFTIGSGGGPSHDFFRPFYQYLVNTGSGFHRATPDISMSAAVNGGALTYTSFPLTSSGEPEPMFTNFGGTSVATPLFAGIVAIADQIAGHPLGLINPRMYQLERAPAQFSGIVDVTSGNNTFTEYNEEGKVVLDIPGYQAVRGYDMASGLGTVDAPAFTHALAGRWPWP